MKYNIECTNIHVTGIPEGEGWKKRTGKLFEQMMANNFPGLMLSINLPNPRSSMSQSMANTKRWIPRYIIIKLLKAKETNHLESRRAQ